MNDGAGLRSVPSFRGLWLANAGSDGARMVAMFATQVAMTLTLHASASQVGLIAALSSAGPLLLGLVAGVFVDRWGPKRTMVASVLVRAVAYGLPVLAWWGGWLRPWQLLLMVLIASVADTFFTAGHSAVLPRLVGRSLVPQATASLMATDQVITLAGPAAGGLLTRLMPAPVVLLVATAGQGIAALGLRRLPRDEPHASAGRESVWVSLKGGLRFLWGTPLLTAMMLASALNNFAAGLYQSAETFFILRDLGMDPLVFGIVWSVSAVGGVLGAMLAPRLGRAFGPLRAMFIACCVMPVNFALIPLTAAVPPLAQPAMVFASFFLFGFCIGTMAVNSAGVAASITPDGLLARVASARRTVTQGATALGALLGAALVGFLGTSVVLWIASALAFAQLVPLLRVGVPRRAEASEDELALAQAAPRTEP